MVTFREIMVDEILYYDPAHEVACATFCRERRIDFMPATEDDYVIYRLQEGDSFVRQELLDPNKFGELLQELAYQFNGELIRILRSLTADRLDMDTYPFVSEAVLEVGKSFRPVIKDYLKKRPLVNSQLLNELGGSFIKAHGDELLERVKDALPVQMTDQAWVEIRQAFLDTFQSDLISNLTPALVYLSRREYHDRLKIVEPDEAIFKEDVYEKLRYSPLLFVMDRGKRVGMVHFSDYNRMPVFIYTFEKLHQLEREIIKVLHKRRLSQEDVWQVHQHSPISDKEISGLNQRNEGQGDAILRFHDLERLYLKTLLKLYNYHKPQEPVSATPIRHPNLINLLRNRVAHAKDLVELADSSRANLVYDFRSFAAFYRQHRALEAALRQVKTHLYFLETAY